MSAVRRWTWPMVTPGSIGRSARLSGTMVPCSFTGACASRGWSRRRAVAAPACTVGPPRGAAHRVRDDCGMGRDSAARLVDVAELAGVTPAVVSRVLNNDGTLRVRPETRERIRAAAAELRYVANARGRALQSARTGTIGLFVPSLTSPVYA